MKRIITVLVLSAALANAQPKSSLIRRLTLAGACIASGLDIVSTHAAVANGAIESNGRFARNGQPRYGLMIGYSALRCGGMAVAQEISPRRFDRAWTATNMGMAGVQGAIAVHNWKLPR